MLNFIFDGLPTAENEDTVHIVASEVNSDFNAPFTVAEQIIRADYPSSLNAYELECWVYKGQE